VIPLTCWVVEVISPALVDHGIIGECGGFGEIVLLNELAGVGDGGCVIPLTCCVVDVIYGLSELLVQKRAGRRVNRRLLETKSVHKLTFLWVGDEERLVHVLDGGLGEFILEL